MNKIGVIGDVFIDKYDYVINRDNPESSAPCYVVLETEYKPGGAGNVAANLKTLGSDVELFSVIGDDPNSIILKKVLDEFQLTYNLIEDSNRFTIVKERVISKTDGRYHYRKDIEKKQYITHDHIEDILNSLEGFKYIIISDYNKGVVTRSLINRLLGSGLKLIVDPKPQHVEYYKDVFMITPNVKEAREMAKVDNELEAALYLQKNLNTSVLLTRSEKGMSYFGNTRLDLATEAKKVFDVTGAGDTVIATLTHFLNKGYSVEESIKLANKAAGISVGYPGCYSVSEKELI